ncbi:MAG: hypothetical protein WC705_03630 [Candidatus Paceibacterota bacterium]|jgi:hypothetical protein
MINFKNKKGQMLAETMVGLGMAVLGILGFLSLLSYAIGLNRVISDQYVSTYLASEGIEVVKNILDGKWLSGDGFGLGEGFYEVDYDSASLRYISSSESEAKDISRFMNVDSSSKRYSYKLTSQRVVTPFKRILHLQQVTNPDRVIVNSKVFWESRSGSDFEINLEDVFFGWR